MKLVLDIVQIVVTVLLTGCVLLQARGSGLGAAFGGSDNIISTRRGAEKGIFIVTIVLSAIFLTLGVFRLLVI